MPVAAQRSAAILGESRELCNSSHQAVGSSFRQSTPLAPGCPARPRLRCHLRSSWRMSEANLSGSGAEICAGPNGGPLSPP